jgi:hypothetical protein
MPIRKRYRHTPTPRIFARVRSFSFFIEKKGVSKRG